MGGGGGGEGCLNGGCGELYFALSFDPYFPVSLFFAKPLMKVLYKGRTHPTTRAHGLACKKLKQFLCISVM